MKHMPTNPHLQPIPLHSLKISTTLRLHSEFSKAPVVFARRHRVDLADDVFPETSFKNDPKSQEKIAKGKANIHLVRHGAIRLFIDRDGDGDWVRSIELNPSLLLNQAEGHPLVHHNLLVALITLKHQVTPLLADPLDAKHIVPGLPGKGDSVAYLSKIVSEILLPGIQRPYLHGLSHLETGPAQGATRTRVQLGKKGDNCVIRFTEAKGKRSEPRGTQHVPGARVMLILKGDALPKWFGRFGGTTSGKDIRRLVSFPASSVALVHQMMMSQLEGTYLARPPEWSDKSLGKPVTHAKTIALLSQLTPIPIEELRSIDEELRAPSKSTRERLDEDVPVAASWLTPIPASSLFTSAVYSSLESGMTTRATTQIDPQVTAAYGEW
jgi:hypothetical protein